MNQLEILDLICQYNNADRTVIKANYKRLMTIYNIKPSDIIGLGFKPNNVYAWSNQSSNNIQMFEQALLIAVKFDFSIKDFWKNI